VCHCLFYQVQWRQFEVTMSIVLAAHAPGPGCAAAAKKKRFA
jgi:hypothetical protein